MGASWTSSTCTFVLSDHDFRLRSIDVHIMSLQSLINGIPPEVIASWPSPNYVDPVTRNWMPGFILAWQITSTLLVCGRFYLRAKKLAGAFGWDDLLIAVAWVC